MVSPGRPGWSTLRPQTALLLQGLWTYRLPAGLGLQRGRGLLQHTFEGGLLPLHLPGLLLLPFPLPGLRLLQQLEEERSQYQHSEMVPDTL